MPFKRTNCIVFDPSYAELYDQTRPTAAEYEAVYSQFLSTILQDFNGGGTIRILDLGCGTGRLSIGIVDAFLKRNQPIDLRIFGVDPSKYMLARFSEKIKTDQRYEEYIELKEGDGRDLSFLSSERIDIVICHWIFHVIADWQNCVLEIDSLLRGNESAKIAFFKEQSELYDAIDGKVESVEDNQVAVFWSEFHTKKRELFSELPGNPALPAAQRRIGTKVDDYRVFEEFKALGWKWDSESKQDRWREISARYCISRTVLLDIVRNRAFTNMLTQAEPKTSALLYEQLAVHLQSILPENYESWFFKGLFAVSFFVRDGSAATDRQRNALGVLKDSLGKSSWRLRLPYYNRDDYYGRTFVQLGRTLIDDCVNVLEAEYRCFFTRHPEFSESGEATEFFLPPSAARGCKLTRSKKAFSKFWQALLVASETNRPFVLFKIDVPNQRSSTVRNVEGSFGNIHRIELIVSDVKACANVTVYSNSDSFRRVFSNLCDHGVIVRERVSDLQTIEIAQAVWNFAHSEQLTLIWFHWVSFYDSRNNETDPFGAALGLANPESGSECLSLIEFCEHFFDEYFEEVSFTANRFKKVCKGVGFGSTKRIDQSEISSGKLPAILVMTTADVELEHVLTTFGVMDQIFVDSSPHPIVYLDESGELGVFKTEQGSTGDQASQNIVSKITAFYREKDSAIELIMASGIAWGIDEEIQSLGDILISTRIHNGNHMRQSTINQLRGGVVDNRGAMFSRIDVAKVAEDFPSHVFPEVSRGVLWSEDKLIDKWERVQEIKGDVDVSFPDETFIGGEMEGWGLANALSETETDWIVVKSICDWGYGKNKKVQKQAAINAACFTRSWLESRFELKLAEHTPP